MNSKATKAALITSLASLVLCFTMLMGTTLAWFVDRVESTNNRIEAGNLEIDLVMLKNGEYVSIAGGNGDLFSEVTGTANAGWYPGLTKTIYLGIRNKGSLALKYDATIDVVDGKLLGALDYTIVDLGTTPPNPGEVMSIADSENSKSGLIADTAQNLLLGSGKLLKILDDSTAAENQNETHYYAFSVHMRDNVAQSFQGATITLDIKVSATQLTEKERTEYEGANHALFEIPDDEKVKTLFKTSWKLKTEVADYTFLEEKEGEENVYIFPEETTISAGEITYPISELRVIPFGETKLLVSVPFETSANVENSGEKTEDKKNPEKVFVYYPQPDEKKENSDEGVYGWYLIAYEDFQKLISDETDDINGLFVSENNITDAENLPIITFPEEKSKVLEDEDLINWLYQSAELTETSEPLS